MKTMPRPTKREVEDVPTKDPSSTSQPYNELRNQAPREYTPPIRTVMLNSTGLFIEQGFPHALPRAYVSQHPFLAHNVSNAEWFRFLDDLKLAAVMGKKKHIAALAMPAILAPCLLPGLEFEGTLTRSTLKRHKKAQGIERVLDVIDLWNKRYFRPRFIEATIQPKSSPWKSSSVAEVQESFLSTRPSKQLCRINDEPWIARQRTHWLGSVTDGKGFVLILCAFE